MKLIDLDRAATALAILTDRNAHTENVLLRARYLMLLAHGSDRHTDRLARLERRAAAALAQHMSDGCLSAAVQTERRAISDELNAIAREVLSPEDYTTFDREQIEQDEGPGCI